MKQGICEQHLPQRDLFMEFTVSASTSYNQENSEILRQTAKNILNNNGASAETTQRIIEKVIFDNDKQCINPELSVLKASTQITLNNSLKETLKYLRAHAYKKVQKQYVLGTLWEIFSANNEASEKNPYKGELVDFEIDKNAKNIFAA